MSSNQRLVFSILEFLNSECESRMEDERESLEVVIECLERVYNVSLSNSSDVSKFHVDNPLTEIFESATKMTTRPFPTDEDKDRAEELKTQGNNLMKEGKYGDAIGCYDQAVKLDWTNAVYLCNRAAACSKLGKNEEAVKNCKEALELDPKYGKAYGRMGTAYMALEKYQEARDSYVKAKELDPGNDLYMTNLKTVEDKLREAQERSSSASQGTGGGPANMMSSLFSNPGIMNMASQFMANPQMQQMMTNMMSGFGGITGDDQSAGQQPPSQPAEGQPDSEATTTPESNTGTTGTNPEAGSGTNPEAGSGAGGYSNIFQFASQMAQQLQQSNPELINDLRQSMQNVAGGNTEPNQNTDDPSKNGKE
ncbi:Small glutamine-rich tetratricopeptide repeat-containing beta [Paramuricea clavata]|uniref:Small glutamine-rich tetratricopeptide repeat-containing beta n=1 Tax=Paramuricea clavata TaxID=317549 RepID=A0A7D9DQ16_PARCT|nr:Small glutamine-rich tetratricopeptide repeat-containing beta [Paramuricea clavata]